MKFLHLSDLHIGKNVNGFSFLDEQRHVFAQIIGYVRSERPDAVIIAGDVYDRAVPGIEAVCVFDHFLTELAREKAAVLLISGNHDSPERLNYASRLLSDKHLYLRGVLEDALCPVILEDSWGKVHFWLLPFLKPSFLRGRFDQRDIDDYGDALKIVLENAPIDYNGRNILVSHQFYVADGAVSIRSESEISPVGGLDAIDASLIERFDYAALGHLHGSQKVGSEAIRYAGSPLKYSFSEWRQDKSVALVELKQKGDLSVKLLPLTPIHDMREVKGKLQELLQGEKSEDYLRIILTDEEEIIDPIGQLRNRYPNIMTLAFENSRTHIDITAVQAHGEKLRRLSPYELFSEFFLEVSGAVMSREQSEIICELLETEEGE